MKTSIATALAPKPATASSHRQQDVTGAGHPIGSSASAGKIHGNFPAGVYHESYGQQMAQFAGAHQLPTGQMINVSMNAPSPHLPFKEWVGRGILGGLGQAAAWPFQLIARIVEAIARMLIKLFGRLVMIVLIPTMLIIGLQLARQVSMAPSVEEGAAQIVHHGRHAATGIAHGFVDELPPENAASTVDPDKQPVSGK